MPLVVGVTGGIGSGKSAVTERLQAKGIEVVDADVVARQVVEPGTPALAAIADRHGPEILLPDGSLDRAALRKRVFADEAERLWLEQLTHPLIGAEITRQLAAAQSPYVILSSPLLLETAQHERAQLVVVVDVPESVQLERTMARDSNDEAQVRRIMTAQIKRPQRLSRADLVVDNSGALESLDAKVDELHRELLARAARAQ